MHQTFVIVRSCSKHQLQLYCTFSSKIIRATMFPMKSLKVTLIVAFTLIVSFTECNDWPTKVTNPDTLSVSDVNKVLNNVSERLRLYQLVDQAAFERPQIVPPCPKGRIYDAIEKICSEPNNQQHCGDNMIFLPVPNTKDLGACACSNIISLKRWGRPQALTVHDQCTDIGTQGPCNAGGAMVPVTKFHAECGADACIHTPPENAINFSEGSKQQQLLYPVFNFTYKGKCYTTESQGFCAGGQVLSFVLPYKIPWCLDRNEVEKAAVVAPAFIQLTTVRDCGPGTVANPTSGICEPVSSFDFD